MSGSEQAVRARFAVLPRPVKVAIIAVPILAVVFLTRCQGNDPNDPTTLEVRVEQVVDEALPVGHCAEGCDRWMAQPPFWYEIVATDEQVAELRSGGWVVNGVPADPTSTEQHIDTEAGGSEGAGDFLQRQWKWLLAIVIVTVFAGVGLGGLPGPHR